MSQFGGAIGFKMLLRSQEISTEAGLAAGVPPDYFTPSQGALVPACARDAVQCYFALEDARTQYRGPFTLLRNGVRLAHAMVSCRNRGLNLGRMGLGRI